MGSACSHRYLGGSRQNDRPQLGKVVPKHIAIIMDGNRRYGLERLGNKLAGHFEGSQTLSRVVEWCIEEGVEILTVYAFSTENWKRSSEEVSELMSIFERYCEQIRKDAKAKNVRLRVLASDPEKLPLRIHESAKALERDTATNTGFCLNLCVSYGSRSEIVGAVRRLAEDVAQGNLSSEDITEDLFSQTLLTGNMPDPDLLIRTSGECRLSNFLLWQLAYTEMVFVNKYWPEFEKNDLLDACQVYSNRQRRFGS